MQKIIISIMLSVLLPAYPWRYFVRCRNTAMDALIVSGGCYRGL